MYKQQLCIRMDRINCRFLYQQDNYAISKINYGNQFKNNFNSSFNIGMSIPILNNLRNKTQIKTALLLAKRCGDNFKCN